MVKSIPLSTLIKNFPFCEPSYSTFVHKKVSTDYYMAIPMGKKYLAWFTHYNSSFVCIFIEVEERNGAFALKSAFIRPCCFNKEIAYGTGTLLYGTIVTNKFFCVEDLFYFRNQSCNKMVPNKKLLIMHTIFSDYVKEVDLLQNNIVFSICLMNESLKLLHEDIKNIDYKIYSIKMCFFSTHKSYKMRYIEEKNDYEIFTVSAEVGTDTYNLYKQDKYVGLAYIPNYKTSVLMNSLFRNIKENANLDAIEESEDEDEFENKNNPEYFVDLKKRLSMKCEYNTNFKSWVPISVANHKM